ncbi:MAG: hypothetical protein WC516_08700 [Patescibacteria group bacterium]|jgi:hypothetical protein
MNIEQLAINVYIAEQERKLAKQVRAAMMQSYQCTNRDDGNNPCYHQTVGAYDPLPIDYWCDNCKKVQPSHIDYRKKAVIANHAKGTLTNTIKKKLTPRCHLCSKLAKWSQSPLGNPDELALCDKCQKKVHDQMNKLALH